jgi:hypothetical protein
VAVLAGTVAADPVERRMPSGDEVGQRMISPNAIASATTDGSRGKDEDDLPPVRLTRGRSPCGCWVLNPGEPHESRIRPTYWQARSVWARLRAQNLIGGSYPLDVSGLTVVQTASRV